MGQLSDNHPLALITHCLAELLELIRDLISVSQSTGNIFFERVDMGKTQPHDTELLTEHLGYAPVVGIMA